MKIQNQNQQNETICVVLSEKLITVVMWPLGIREALLRENKKWIKVASNTTAGYVIMYIQNDVMMFKNVI